MKKILLLIFIVCSLLLLLPACGTQVGYKGKPNLKGKLSIDGELTVIDEEGNQQRFKTDILKIGEKVKICNRQKLNIFLDEYVNGLISQEKFLAGVNDFCPELNKGKSYKESVEEINKKDIRR